MSKKPTKLTLDVNAEALAVKETYDALAAKYKSYETLHQQERAAQRALVDCSNAMASARKELAALEQKHNEARQQLQIKICGPEYTLHRHW